MTYREEGGRKEGREEGRKGRPSQHLPLL